ncbi:MAG: TIGR04283 family arsenosugar biosynthesis glycosyltransferase [Acetobacteraceae bacterium]|nr:TIGR04283 family arsenosugar biosynthesis glycosyltransferase [Acetobacteraceae bacterium]
MLTIIVPTLNAARTLPATLAACAEARALEHIVVDGGSQDGTAALAERLGARVVRAPRGRGVQLAAGAEAARGSWLLFLHADSRPAPGWAAAARAAMDDPARAAHFTFALDDPSPQARRLERRVAWRCRRLALPYGDQGLLIARALYMAVGGYRPLPLMEDVDLVRRLGRNRLTALPAPVVTSAERWRREGWRRRSARNLFCLGLWFAGVPPRIIQRIYG